MRNKFMLCFTFSTSLVVLQLGEMCPMPWAVLPGGFWCSVAVCSLDPVLFIPCSRWNPVHSVVVELLMYFRFIVFITTVPIKHLFFLPTQKQDRSGERWKKQIYNICSRWRSVHWRLKSGRWLSFITPEVLVKPFLVSWQTHTRTCMTTVLLVVSAVGRQGMAVQQSSPWGAVQAAAPPLQ